MASAVTFAVYALLDAAPRLGMLSDDMLRLVVIIQPLFLVFGAINGLVAVVINPWRVDRLPDRFPTIVQDSIVIGLFAVGATLLLQEKIFATTAVGAVVLGFALQDTLGNLFAGLAIQIEKPFRVGHWVRIADIDGMVSEITWRATKVRTKAGNFVIVPNNKLSGDIIINYSEPNLETRIELEVGVTYDAPPNLVKSIIIEAIQDEPLMSRARKPEVLLVDFADSAITYRIRAWTTNFADDDWLRDHIRVAIYYAFRRRKIEIPFPMQVQFNRNEPVSSEALAPEAQAVLRAVPIFAALSPEEQGHLVRTAVSGLYAARDVIVRQGESGNSMFVVVHGEAVVTLEPDGQEVARIGPGGYFGEMSLLTGAPRNATVTADCDSELLEITAEAFRRFVLANPNAVEAIGVAVAARRAELEEHRAAGVATAAIEASDGLVDRIRRFLGLEE